MIVAASIGWRSLEYRVTLTCEIEFG